MWTKTPPTKPGYYWWRSFPEAPPEPVLVLFQGREAFDFSGVKKIGDTRLRMLDWMGGEWGPEIPLPEEAS